MYHDQGLASFKALAMDEGGITPWDSPLQCTLRHMVLRMILPDKGSWKILSPGYLCGYGCFP